MNYSMKKFIAAKEKDKVLLKSWITSKTVTAATDTHNVRLTTEIEITPKKTYTMPFYSGESKKEKQDKFAPYRWLIK